MTPRTRGGEWRRCHLQKERRKLPPRISVSFSLSCVHSVAIDWAKTKRGCQTKNKEVFTRWLPSDTTWQSVPRQCTALVDPCFSFSLSFFFVFLSFCEDLGRYDIVRYHTRDRVPVLVDLARVTSYDTIISDMLRGTPYNVYRTIANPINQAGRVLS